MPHPTQQTQVLVKKLPNLGSDLPLPKYATEHSAGVDLYAAIDIDNTITIKPGETALVPSGIAIALPDNMEAQIRPRSGLALKHSITVLNAPGTIDADYRGEIKAVLINHGKEDFVISRGMRIAQMIIARYEKIDFAEVDNLEATERGFKGFGSTGQQILA